MVTSLVALVRTLVTLVRTLVALVRTLVALVKTLVKPYRFGKFYQSSYQSTYQDFLLGKKSVTPRRTKSSFESISSNILYIGMY
jgi:hypothetical protein